MPQETLGLIRFPFGFTETIVTKSQKSVKKAKVFFRESGSRGEQPFSSGRSDNKKPRNMRKDNPTRHKVVSNIIQTCQT